MKYMRKTPVEAIQWNGHNLNEVSEFISHATKSYSMWSDSFDNLDITYSFQKGRTSRAVIPLFGWVVKDGKSFEFYKDATFRKTFEEARDDDNNGIDWERFINAMKEPIGGFDNVPKGFKDILGEYLWSPFTPAFVDVDGLYKGDEKTREEIKKNLSEGLKEMAGSDTHKATFESVLDEMKELHAKKDKDYGSAFHKSFEEFGVTAGVVRLNDKMERVKSLVKNGKVEVKDESLLDSLEDLACYAVMLYVELKNKDNGKL